MFSTTAFLTTSASRRRHDVGELSSTALISRSASVRLSDYIVASVSTAVTFNK